MFLQDAKIWIDKQLTQQPRTIITLYVMALSVVVYVGYDTRQKINDSEAGHKQSIEIRQYGRASEPLITLNFRADFTIPDLERRNIVKAVDDLDRVSCGLAKVNLVWDYSRERDLPRAALRGDNVVQGVSILDVETSLGRDDADVLLGMTRSSKNPRWNPVWIFLVTDRLEEDAQLTEWTMLHELGHALGMDHVKNGLMEPHTPYFFNLEDRPEWSTEDQHEFCKIYQCDPSVFIRCKMR